MLSRLEVRGFKSFAGQTVLDLGPGVNVVVGPTRMRPAGSRDNSNYGL